MCESMLGRYAAKFEYSGKEPSNKRFVEKTYVKAYNRYCKRTNSVMKELNDAFDFDGKSEEDYLAYMIENMNQYAEKEYASSILYPMLFRRFFIGDELEFRAELPDGSSMAVYLRKV